MTSPFDDVKKGESYFEREIFCDTLLFCYVLDIFCCVGHLLLCHVFLFCGHGYGYVFYVFMSCMRPISFIYDMT